MSSLPAESPTEETAIDVVAMTEKWREELATLENEIEALSSVLERKKVQANDLKRKLGIPVPEDSMLGLKNVKESIVYQKTESMVKSTAEKTVSILGGIGSNISNKLGQIKNSESFRSFEEKVGSAYENVKGRVTPSRSMSNQSFLDALHEQPASGASSPTTIPEERPSLT